MEEGSKLLRLAMFPVAKKEKKTRKKKRSTALTSSISSPGFDSPPCPVSKHIMTLVNTENISPGLCQNQFVNLLIKTEINICKTQLAENIILSETIV